MSYPFIIWTLQRTGGTSLANLLMSLSEHPRVEHEPFNWRRAHPRQFGPVAETWVRDRDEARVDASLARIFGQRHLIKHCYELPEHSARHRGAPFNARLIRAVAKTDYRNILLLRRDEMGRLISKYVAEANGTWFDDYAPKVYEDIVHRRRELKPLPVGAMVKHYQHCLEVTRQLRAQARRFGVSFYHVAYEDIYEGAREERMARLEALFDHIGLAPDTIEAHRDTIEDKIFRRRFDTRAIAPFLPNLDAVRDGLEAVGYREASAGDVFPGLSWLDSAKATLERGVSVLRFRRAS